MNTLTLTRAEIIDKLVRDLNINRVDATRIFEDMLEEIFVAMKDSHCVKISSFGSFFLGLNFLTIYNTIFIYIF